jgi:hypothetical protein
MARSYCPVRGADANSACRMTCDWRERSSGRIKETESICQTSLELPRGVLLSHTSAPTMRV